MGTGRDRLERNEYQIDGSSELNDEQDSLLTKVGELWAEHFRGSAIQDQWTCTYAANKITVSGATTRRAILGDGEYLKVVNGEMITGEADCTNLGFENDGASVYKIGFKFAEYPSNVKVLTGPAGATPLYRYSEYREAAGFSFTPNSIANPGGHYILNISNPVWTFEGGANPWQNPTTRKAIVWMNDGNGAYPETSDLTDALTFNGTTGKAIWTGLATSDGSDIEIDLGTNPFNQTTPSTDVNDYVVLILGPVISNTTVGGGVDPSSDADYFYVGSFNSATSTFSYTGQKVFPTMADIQFDLQQICVDCFGSNYTLDQDGLPNLANSVHYQDDSANGFHRALEACCWADMSTARKLRLLAHPTVSESTFVGYFQPAIAGAGPWTMDYTNLINNIIGVIGASPGKDISYVDWKKSDKMDVSGDSWDGTKIATIPAAADTYYVIIKWFDNDTSPLGDPDGYGINVYSLDVVTSLTIPNDCVILASVVVPGPTVTYYQYHEVFGAMTLQSLKNGYFGNDTKKVRIPLQLNDATYLSLGGNWIQDPDGLVFLHNAAEVLNQNYVNIPFTVKIRGENTSVNRSTQLYDFYVYVKTVGGNAANRVKLYIAEYDPTAGDPITWYGGSGPWTAVTNPRLLNNVGFTSIGPDQEGWFSVNPDTRPWTLSELAQYLISIRVDHAGAPSMEVHIRAAYALVNFMDLM